ncbi:MAG: hypothetical protein FGM14_15080 [Flavobacteriales bacterium]|nr:hypothetical protein [Flavobacteriales bacterium]
MKINLNKIMFVVFGIIYIAFFTWFLYGCSANYHFTKFIKKGGTIENKSDTIEVTRTIKINGKDSVIIMKVTTECPQVQIPPTRKEVKYKYKYKIDSLQTVRYVTKWKLKETVKTEKAKSNPWKWFLIGLVVGVVLFFILRFVFR